MTRYELGLQDYIRIVKKRKFIIIFSFLVFTMGSYFYTTSQVPVYQASTTVKIEERKTVAGLLTEIIVYAPGDLMETQTNIIQGFPVIKRAAEYLELIESDTSAAQVYTIVGTVQSKISTETVGQTNIIRIIATAAQPQEAAELANAVAKAYIDENLLNKNKQARTARQFIQNQLAALEERSRKAENDLKNFSQEVEHINIAADSQKRLTELEYELASLLQKYTDKHPKVLQLKERIAQLEGQFKGFSGEELKYARLQREVEVNRKIYAMLREKLEEVRITEAEKVPDVSIVDPAIVPTQAINYQSKINILMGSMLGAVLGMILAFVTETLDTSVGTIEDVENLLKIPVLGVVPSITADKSKSIHFLDKIKRRFFAKKKDDAETKYVRLASHFKPTHPTAEAFRNIKTNIKFSSQRKTIILTSAGPQEGKTTILINLGLVAAQEGLKTLLVSSDLRRPSIAESFGFDKKPGLSDVVMGTVNLEEALRGTSDMLLGGIDIDNILKHPGLDHIWVLPAGSLPLNPTEILDSKEMDRVIAELKKDFDVILFDSPPILPVTDASVIAPKVDAAILCYEIGKTSRHALLRAKVQLDAVEASIIGVILNHIAPETEAVEVYPYYYKYKYRYYGKEKGSDSKKG